MIWLFVTLRVCVSPRSTPFTTLASPLPLPPSRTFVSSRGLLRRSLALFSFNNMSSSPQAAPYYRSILTLDIHSDCCVEKREASCKNLPSRLCARYREIEWDSTSTKNFTAFIYLGVTRIEIFSRNCFAIWRFLLSLCYGVLKRTRVVF